jgi:signal transduction histidine kinase/DNA-binding NarL/FixJ family response regulator
MVPSWTAQRAASFAVAFVLVALGAVTGRPWLDLAGSVLMGALAIQCMRTATRDQARRAKLERTLAARAKGLEASQRALAEATAELAKNEAARAGLEEQLEQAREASRAKSTFLSSMSHDLRTPLTSVLGYAELLRGPNVDERTRIAHARTIVRSGRHLLHLLNQLLDSAKVEAGAMSINEAQVELGELVAEIGEQMQINAHERRIAFAIALDTAIPTTVRTDGVRVRQILENLVGNAIKFTERGKVELRLALRDGRLSFRVVDTGPGLTPEQLGRLFGEFVQLDEKSVRNGVGTGLGLNLSRKLAVLLGGDVTVTSVHGEGSTFTLEIPARFEPGTPMVRSLESRAASSFGAPPERFVGTSVLVADDTESTRALMRVFLEHAGATVELARDGQEVVDRYSWGPVPDVAFVDVQMPHVDGMEAVRRLRERGVTAPIVALTGLARDSDREACLAAGFDAWLVKPVMRNEILAALESFAPRNSTSSTRAKSEAGAPMRSLSDDPLVQSVLETFYEELNDAVPRLRSTRPDEVAETAHALAGAGGTFGFDALSEKARAVELALKKKRDLASASEELCHLLETCDRILASRPAPPLGAARAAGVGS